MAYQNVGTPRFYVNEPLWLKSNGIIHDNSPDGSAVLPDTIIDMNPSARHSMPAGFHRYTVNVTNWI